MIPYKLVRSTRKTIAIYVSGADGQVEVRAPRTAALAQIQAFVDSKAAWIAQKQAALRASAPPARAFNTGERFYYLGETYPLEIVPHNSPALRFTGGKFLLASAAQPRARETFTRWYRAQARAYLQKRVAELSAFYNIGYTKIRCSSARTRWGSCSSTGTLSFTWRLIMAPPAVIDYVIVHELAHVLHKNHSRRFWEQVAAMMPDYKQRAAWLKQHGRQIAAL